MSEAKKEVIKIIQKGYAKKETSDKILNKIYEFADGEDEEDEEDEVECEGGDYDEEEDEAEYEEDEDEDDEEEGGGFFNALIDMLPDEEEE